MFSLTGNYCKKGRGTEWKGGENNKKSDHFELNLMTQTQSKLLSLKKLSIHFDKVFCLRKPFYAGSGQPLPYYCGNCSWNQPAQSPEKG